MKMNWCLNMMFEKYKKLVATQPFYKKYHYRIKARILNNFYEPYLKMALDPNAKPNNHSYYRMYNQEYIIQHYPRTQQELDMRLDIYDEITNIVGKQTRKSKVAKIRCDVSQTMMYITDAETYNKIMDIPNIKTYIVDVTEPAFQDYAAVKSKLAPVEEVRKCLYFSKYRYKVCLRASNDIKEILQFRELATASSEVFVSSALRYIHARRYFQYSLLSVACDDDATASYLAMIGGDMVVSVKKAVLVDELK